MDGTWRSRGYGQLLTLGPDEVRWYDTTELGTLEVRRSSRPEFDRDFAAASVADDVLRLRSPCSITTYDFDPVAAPGTDTPRAGAVGDPVWNFDVFWQTFWEQFGFFDVRGVDWPAVRDELRPRLTRDSTPDDLREVLRAAVERFADGHVVVHADDSDIQSDPSDPAALLTRWRLEAERRGAEAPDMDAGSRRWIRDRSGIREPRSLANGRLVVGRLDDVTGYLATMEMSLSDAGHASTCAEVEAMRRGLAEVRAALPGIRRWIVDARFNLGGLDEVALALASAFNDQRRLVCTKRARDGDGWTAPQSVYLDAATGTGLDGPVVLLTSRSTASAAEVLIMAMRTVPTAAIVGQHTSGVTSDQLMKRLPNGWTFSLSNELYQTTDGVCHERVGIPPHVLIEPEPDETADDHLDRVLAAARTLIAP